MKTLAKYALAAAAFAAAWLPLYWLLTIALKRDLDQFADPPLWFAFTPTLEHFREAFLVRNFSGYFLNSFIVVTVSTLASLAFGIPAAYALARFEWPNNLGGRISFWILSTRMLPPIVTVVPMFLMLRDARLLNSPLALIIMYTAFNLPFTIWMLRGFFEETPREIEEAAMLDGESRWGALIRVVLPLAAPGIAATAIFCAIAGWNEFLFALVFTQTDASITLPVGIAARVTQYEIKWGVMAAAGVMAMLPVLVFAGFAQRYLVRGLSMGAVKG